MIVNPLIFRAYDIRGIAHKPISDKPIDLNPETAHIIGQGVGTYLLSHNGPEIAVGGDNRLSTPELKKAFINGLLSTGCNVTDIGLASSPLLYYATCKLGMDGGINITASHNPKEYNGIKVVGEMAHAICGDELQIALNIIEENSFTKGYGQLTERNDIFDLYLADMQKIIKIDRPLKVAIDAGNGITGKFAPDLLRAFGCEVKELYCELDGNFPNHEANPEDEENLLELIDLMKTGEYDIGIGFDGDGDRIGLIDETGKHYAADLHLLLLAEDLLSRHPGATIVFDVKASQTVPDLIRKYGGEPVMAKTGHSFIEKTMQEKGALLAGEVSGHLFFGENYYGFDDAFMAALRTLAILAKGTKKLSSYFAKLPKTCATPEIKVPCPDEHKFRIVEELKEYFMENYDCITIDGVRMLFDQETWGIIRCSNTTPNLTMRFESQDQGRLNNAIKIVADVMKQYPEIDMSWYNSFKAKA